MMRSVLIFMLFLLPIKASFADDVISSETVLQDTLQNWIRPGYAEFQNQSIQLEADIAKLCSEPSNELLKVAQNSFDLAAISWAEIEWFRVGPVMSENMLERILFYPDRKSTGLKQVQRALANQDKTALTAATLSQKSVAMQGFGALEFLLFGTGYEALTTPEDDYRCDYAHAIADNVHNIAAELLSGWADDTDLTQFWLKPDQTNPLFRDDFEALSQMIGTLIHGLEAIKDVRIGAFLKDEAQKDRPKSALFWRSENTLPMVVANVEGLKMLLFESGFLNLLPEDSSLGGGLNFEFDQSIKTALSFEKPVLDHLENDEDRQRLVYLAYTLSTIIQKLDQNFAPALGLKAGFSFGDGD